MTLLERIDYLRALETAAAEGKKIERRKGDNNWVTTDLNNYCCSALEYPHEYRIAPSLTRPWNKPEDVPGPVCWLRFLGSVEAMVIHLFASGLSIVDSSGKQFYSWDSLRKAEHSTDRKTWHPCTVTEAP